MTAFESEWETPEYETLASLANDLVFRLPGCTDLMVRKAISSVYRDFCKRTCVLKTKRTIEVVNGVNSYAVRATLTDCVVDTIVEAYLNGRKLEDGEGFASAFGDTVYLHDRYLPSEGSVNTLELVMIEVPKLSSEHAPSLFIQRFGDAIQDGVLWELMSMLNRPWSDAQMAFKYQKAYENALTENRARYYSGGNLSSGKLNFIKKGNLL